MTTAAEGRCQDDGRAVEGMLAGLADWLIRLGRLAKIVEVRRIGECGAKYRAAFVQIDCNCVVISPALASTLRFDATSAGMTGGGGI